MCGIFGIISKNQISNDLLIELTNYLSHRGPDSFGTTLYSDNNYFVGLGHRRLSILDPDSRSNQPFKSNDLSIEVVFNGEIYNFQDIKKLCKNYSFKTTSDTEVIIASYLQFGLDSFKMFNGIFAFSLLDKRLNKIYLVRDRHGVKPLYYHYDEAKSLIIFSSELRPITNFPGFSKSIDKTSLYLMLSLKYIPSPFSIYSNVFKLLPGHFIEISNDLSMKNVKYFDLIDEFKANKKNKPTEEEVFNEIEASIKRNLISDRGISTFLSGGIDSTLVTLIANKYVKDLTTFTIGFEDAQFDESVYVKEIADKLKIKNIQHIISYSEMVDISQKLPTIYDEPFADSSQIPTYLVHKLVKDSGDTVVLAGDGGDEHFYGYNIFEKSSKRLFFFRLGNLILKYFKFLTPFLLKNNWLKLFIPLISIEYYYLYLYSASDMINSARVLREDVNLEKATEPFSFLNRIKNENALAIEALFSQKIYMVDDCLVKVDRASMKNGVETRVPLLDYTLTSLANSLKPSQNFRKKEKKILLKKLLSRYLPKELFNRPKKGFSIPLQKLLNEKEIKTYLESLSLQFINKQNIFKFKEINNILNDFYKNDNNKLSSFVWSYYMFQKWYETYIS
jgi:asparagine synthase (glutamine-hydrolysing)